MENSGKSNYLKAERTDLKAGKRTVAELLEEMSKTGFQGRKLGELLGIWKRMLSDRENVIFMGLSGAMVPAGMGGLVSYLIENRMIDVLVTTGAALSHDFYQVLGWKHYLGTHRVDDGELQRLKIDRVYDVYADENGFIKADDWIIDKLPKMMEDDRPYSTREVAEILGRTANDIKPGNGSIITTAQRKGVPIFVPAFGDSSIGFALMMANRRHKRRIIVDMMRDVDQICQITETSGNTSVVIIGGGVPKNYIQQSAVVAGYETKRGMMHNFGIAITTDSPQWGGLSGCTFEESKSWGKYVKEAMTATCYCDATIALPMLVDALAEWEPPKKRVAPVFDWSNNVLSINYGQSRRTWRKPK